MMRFKAVYKAEFKRALHRQALLIIAGVIFILLPILSSSISITASIGSIGMPKSNSEIAVVFILTGMNFFFLIFIAIIGGANAAPTENKVNEYLFATPLKRIELLFGKFLGGLTPFFLLLFFQTLLFILSQVAPWAKVEVEKFEVLTFIRPFFTIIVPIVLFLGSIGFLAATSTKRMIVPYALSTFIFMAFILLLGITSAGYGRWSINTQELLKIIDFTGLSILTDYLQKLTTQPGFDASKLASGLIPLPFKFILQRIGLCLVSVAFIFGSILFVKQREVL